MDTPVAYGEEISRRWGMIASHADVARFQPKHNMDAYVAIERELEAIKELILNMPADDFVRTLNKE